MYCRASAASDRAFFHQACAFAVGHQFVILIEGFMVKNNDAICGPGFAFPRFHDRRAGTNAVTVIDGLREIHVSHGKIADRGAQRRISNRNTDHHPKRKDAVDQGLAKFGIFSGPVKINM